MILGPRPSDVKRVASRALQLRKQLGLSLRQSLSIIEILEFEIRARIFRDFALIVSPDRELRVQGVYAFCGLNPPRIFVRELVYRDAVGGRTYARHILAHELGHIYLGHKREDEERWNGEFSSSLEWEANEFASELLMPSNAAVEMLSRTTALSDVASSFKVSQAFVESRLSLLRVREERRIRGWQRVRNELPPLDRPLGERFVENCPIGEYIISELLQGIAGGRG
jgi:hypothetical protein